MSSLFLDDFSRASFVAIEPFRKRFLLAWQAYERLVGRKVDGQEFAKALGVSRPLVAAWEAATEPPPHKRVRKIAAVTGLSAGWLAYGPSDATVAPPPVQAETPAALRKRTGRREPTPGGK